MSDSEVMELKGADFLIKKLEAFGPTVSNRAASRGVAKTAAYVRREFRRAAPEGDTKNLKKSIQLKTYGRPRNGGPKKAYVGLRKIKGETQGRWYYRTLEFTHKRGEPYFPFFEKTWESIKRRAAEMIIEETTKQVYLEAGKVYRQSLSRKGAK